MACKILVTDKANADLNAILDYIMHKLANPPAAMAFLDAVYEAYDRLSESPMLYALCRQPLLASLGLRKVVIRGYLMLYKYDQTENTIYIERFFSDLEDYVDKV